jgi:hypothetical protein
MNFGMTRRAQRKQVRYCVVAERAAELHLMNLQVFCSSATLATPAISSEYSSAQLTICSASKFDLRTLRSAPAHAVSFSSFRSSLLCGPGTNANRRRIESKSVFELGSSRLASARKSAQIISRQNPRDFCAPRKPEGSMRETRLFSLDRTFISTCVVITLGVLSCSPIHVILRNEPS